MWINLQGKNINFDLVEEFYREKKDIYLVNLNGDRRYISYTSESKAKQVEQYIINKLNGNIDGKEDK